MERVIRKHNSGDIACNDTIIYSENQSAMGKRLVGIYDDWKVIEPKYYIYRDDNTIIELWYNNKGIILSGKIKGYIGNYWTNELREEITYEEAMYLLNKENGEPRFDITKSIKESKGNLCCETGIDYGLNDHMVDAMAFYIYENELTRYKKKDEDDKQNNNGGASDWYKLPENANTLQDLIEHRNMNGSVKDIFKACYRLGIKTEDELRDLNKMAYYSLREVGRITSRKDYITIAKELMGSQADEKDENDI